MIKRVLVRGVRSLLSTAVGAFVAAHAGDPRWIALTPALQALGKLLRERFPKAADLVPF